MPVNIGSQLELMVDDHLIESMTGGAAFELHHPVLTSHESDAQPVMPWGNVFKTGGRYQMIVRALKDPKVGWKEDGPEAHYLNHILLYYESKDGVHWKAPKLDLHALPAFPAGNVIMMDEFGVEQTFAAFLDTRPGVPAAERYKGLGGKSYPDAKVKEFSEKYAPPGLRAYASPDGIHWKRLHDAPVIPGAWGKFDSQNIVFWSEQEQSYLCYFRSFENKLAKSLRSVKRTTSKDFREWSQPVDVQINLPGEELYTSNVEPYFRAPHLYIGLPTRYLSKRGSSTDIMFVSSRDGLHFDRTAKDAFIRPGLDPAAWGNRSNYTAYHIVPTSPEEISIYASAGRRYTLRTDGFMSIHAPYEGGEWVTKPLIFTGKKLILNFATSAGGQIRVEVQDANGAPIEGFKLDQSKPLIGDAIERAAAWAGGNDVSALAGKPVRLRFEMSDADVFSLRFR
ncbi:hypothetical protein [Prosthecobacter sp.]|uniref:hypothetical protein n=1 Tax=Prosthecobacter sp. TaxID=1965333 RepID=UPI001DFBAC2E|nr:hypothetical protein [Prosthecobacter sp.]MCB1278643.1 hypothetical protein [Prosthecobacter sp.]